MNMLAAVPASRKRLHIMIRGQVQGVGFRPYLYHLAKDLALTGWALNDRHGVSLEIQGNHCDRFVQRLHENAPPLAKIDGIQVKVIDLVWEERDFSIKESLPGRMRTRAGPDMAVCESCLEELFDPGSRYYRYPFLNCTQCGPRYTVTHALPYDRSRTSLQDFPLCIDCNEEYTDPDNRRFHAQATACPQCGPLLSHSFEEIQEVIRNGGIVALKGVGGFHLFCDARNPDAVTLLRTRKQRNGKPFAIMVANTASARLHVEVNEEAERLLGSLERSIVLLPRRESGLAADIAPGLQRLGVMLPSAPVHYLLFHQAAGSPPGTCWLRQPQELVLVATSANPRGEPLIVDNRAAQTQLKGIADLVVTHNREIVRRMDDSVILLQESRPVMVRRARGYVPQPIKLPRHVPPILAVGGYLKNSVCITREDEAFVSQHIGDLDDPDTLRFFEDCIADMRQVLGVEPCIVAHDMHPDFYSSRYAHESGLATLAVQHHHAHLAAVAAEQHIEAPVLGLALDGFGLGPDGASWGGEMLLLEGPQCTRLGHLARLRQPGGEAAAREPWRMGAAVLAELGHVDDIPAIFSHHPEAGQLADLLKRDLHCPSTSSAGRWFDAAAGLLGVCPLNQYEAQAAMLLEAKVRKPRVLDNAWRIHDSILDLLPLMDRLREYDDSTGAEYFHGTFTEALVQWLKQSADTYGINRVILGGGCFLNTVLTQTLVKRLGDHGIDAILPQWIPPNDSCLSLGQAWVAALQIEAGMIALPQHADDRSGL